MHVQSLPTDRPKLLRKQPADFEISKQSHHALLNHKLCLGWGCGSAMPGRGRALLRGAPPRPKGDQNPGWAALPPAVLEMLWLCGLPACLPVWCFLRS